MSQTTKAKVKLSGVTPEGKRRFNIETDGASFFVNASADDIKYCLGEALLASNVLKEGQTLEITVSYRILNK